jgi:hypothetical protein
MLTLFFLGTIINLFPVYNFHVSYLILYYFCVLLYRPTRANFVIGLYAVKSARKWTRIELNSIIMALQPFVGPWALFSALDPIHSR